MLNFEVARCMEGFPVELHPSVLKLLADIGKYFAKRIEVGAAIVTEIVHRAGGGFG